MAVLDVINQEGKKVSQAELADDCFNVEVKSSVLHEVVKMQLAKRRAGSAAVKNRSDIRGSSRKLFRQKGTGRARRGNIKSPLLRGGGVAFGPHPKDWGYKVPKKVRRLALKMALSSKLQEESLTILDQISLAAIKTKDFAAILAELDIDNALIVTSEKDEKLELSSRNLPQVKILRTEGLNVYDILKYNRLVLLEPSIKQIEGRLA
ncbi:MAG: 50S ribosomal protein L4 [Desulfobacterales bacterium]|nr:50S ribosomal protein L4 [Desulfobacterales bacterium]MDJ0876232.1 50S ribosomal protein L4 [Desulfobacterales bacterium]